MKKNYDKENDIISVNFGKVEHSRELKNVNIVLDFDKDDNIVGIEIFDYMDTMMKGQSFIDKLFSSKRNYSQQRSELNQHTAGGHDEQRASTPNRKINSGFEGTGKPSKKSSADSLKGTYDKKQPEDKVIFLKDSDLIDVAKKLRDSETNDKTKCGLSIDGQCRGNFSPLKCDGLDIPEECLPMMKNKEKKK